MPGLHIAQVVADRAAGEGRRRVGVLGTAFTMDGPVYPQALDRHGIRAEVPEAADRDTVDRVIFSELVDGVVTDASRRHRQDVVRRLAARGCDAVALACTELPLLLTAQTSPLPVLDSTRLLARTALDVALERHPPPTWRGGSFPA
jgi:aspartate racemase